MSETVIGGVVFASPQLQAALRTMVGGQGLVSTAKRIGVNSSALAAAAAGFGVRRGTLAILEAAVSREGGA